MSIRPRNAVRLATALALMMVLSSGRLYATAIANPHLTDGTFTTPAEWGSVTPSFFPVVGNTGGAYLYAAQAEGNLYLMYDYVNSNSLGLNGSNSFFDVFFQVPGDADYLVRITPGTNTPAAYEKAPGTVAPTPGGSFDPTQAPWTPLNAADLTLAQFQSAIGFGPSPNSATPHLMAEFQLTINTASTGPPNGLYSPNPAFWSASAGGQGGVGVALADPPISSGIFMLNPDGSVTIQPVLGPNGGPVLQPQDVVPEPATLTLAGLGASSGSSSPRGARIPRCEGQNGE